MHNDLRLLATQRTVMEALDDEGTPESERQYALKFLLDMAACHTFSPFKKGKIITKYAAHSTHSQEYFTHLDTLYISVSADLDQTNKQSGGAFLFRLRADPEGQQMLTDLTTIQQTPLPKAPKAYKPYKHQPYTPKDMPNVQKGAPYDWKAAKKGYTK